jgi:hypothetical protein
LLAKQPARIVGPLSHSAVDPDFAVARQFFQPIPQLPKRDVDRSFERPSLKLSVLPDIEKQRAADLMNELNEKYPDSPYARKAAPQPGAPARKESGK